MVKFILSCLTMLSLLISLLNLWQLGSVYALRNDSALSSCNPTDGIEFIACKGSNVVLFPGFKYCIGESVKVTTHYSLDGQGATLQCIQNNTGIIVSYSDQITLKNVSISSCGTVQESQTHEKLQFEVAVFINRSSNITLSHVDITNSIGYGLALVNCRTLVTITDSTFEGNHGGTEELPGGGGVYIEQTEASNGSETRFEIVRSNFINNNASTGKNSPEYKGTYILFGRGGGLSINLKTQSVNVVVQHCHFENNTAYRGGGLFVFFLDDSRNNTVSVSECNFTSNQCTVQQLPESIFSAGGGIVVLFLPKTSLNHCIVKHCNFTGNVAYYGGGISVEARKSNEGNGTFLIEESVFTGNSAKIGSAMDLFCSSYFEYDDCHCIVTPEIRNVKVERNRRLYEYANSNKKRTFATIYIENQKVLFSGEVNITDNQASGVALENSVMEIMLDAVVQLSQNTAQMGGGLCLLGDSAIHVHEGVELTIIGNMAVESGGGVYVKQIGQFFGIHSYKCFVQYKSGSRKDKFIHPNHWNVSLMFQNNTAGIGIRESSNLFAVSIYPCVFPVNGLGEMVQDVQEEIHSTFCNWNSWHFDAEDCHNSIRTLPQSFSQQQYNVTLYPDVKMPIENFSVFDDLEHDVTSDSLFMVEILSAEKIGFHGLEVTSSGIKVSGLENQALQVLVQTAYQRSTSATVNVTIKGCPLGYELQNGTCMCIIRSSQFLKCVPGPRHSISVFISVCVGYGHIEKVNTSLMVSSVCSFTAVNPLGPNVEVAFSPDEFNNEFCHRYNRTGFLCEECIEGYGINVFSPVYECIQCDSERSYINWLKAISAVIGPQTILFVFMVLFHVGITGPSMTAYIFFSHVITLPLEIIVIRSAWNLVDNSTRAHSSVLTDIVVSPYRIWNFDYPEIFHVKTCLHHNFRIMHAIAFRYLHALYPILLLVTALVLIELHARNCKPIVYLWKPLCFLCVRIRQKWEVKTSVIDAFATVILLSYSKIINTSLTLFTYNHVRNSNYTKIETRLGYDTSVTYLKGQHIVFASIAIFMLCTFGAIPPLLLLLYPSRLFFKVLAKLRLGHWHGLHVFVDTFQGSFKNRVNGSPERRWFAGLYFIFRIIIYALHAFAEDLVQAYYFCVIAYTAFTLLILYLKPYKKRYYTYLDATFMAILAITHSLLEYGITYVQTREELPKLVFYPAYALLLVPNLYLLVYLIYLLFTRSRSTFVQKYCISRVRKTAKKVISYFGRTHTRHAQSKDSSGDVCYSNGYARILEDGPTHSSLDDLSFSVPDHFYHLQRFDASLEPQDRTGVTRVDGVSRADADSRADDDSVNGDGECHE